MLGILYVLQSQICWGKRGLLIDDFYMGQGIQGELRNHYTVAMPSFRENCHLVEGFGACCAGPDGKCGFYIPHIRGKGDPRCPTQKMGLLNLSSAIKPSS